MRIAVTAGAMRDAEDYKLIYLLAQLERDGIELISCGASHEWLRVAGALQYFDVILQGSNVEGCDLVLDSADQISYAYVLERIGKRRARTRVLT